MVQPGQNFGTPNVNFTLVKFHKHFYVEMAIFWSTKSLGTYDENSVLLIIVKIPEKSSKSPLSNFQLGIAYTQASVSAMVLSPILCTIYLLLVREIKI